MSGSETSVQRFMWFITDNMGGGGVCEAGPLKSEDSHILKLG